ncbi:GTP-binding protein [Brevibacterium sp.]|uniref:GTP-binding protein n=1 Tax=Brevibacterium sp. TaxID=1701 RepID=UPI0028111FBF|nr:GTP-binding protein [Brevibacterium sp.]
MPQVDVIAVTGVCAAERRSYALELAKERGYIFIPGEQTSRGIDAVDRMISLACSAFNAPGVLLEYPAEAPAQEIVGALTTGGVEARLSDLVCVLDVGHLLEDLDSDVLISNLVDRGDASMEYSTRAELLVSQLEFASTVVLVNSDSLPPGAIEQMAALVSHLAPNSHLFHRGNRRSVHRSARYSFLPEPPSAGWVALLNREFAPRFHAPGITAYRYEQVRPFHPGRLWQALSVLLSRESNGRVLRSAGFAHLATRPHITASWDQVGRSFQLTALSLDHQLAAEDEVLAFGQDLALFGIGLDQQEVSGMLDEAVLDDGELTAGPMLWATFPDPFPEWNTADT